MRLYNFIAYKENIFENENKIILKEDLNHLKNVLRLNNEDKIRVVDGQKEYLCRIASIEKYQVILEILEAKNDEDNRLNVTAAVALIKSQNFSTIVKEFTEIGISNLIPLYTKRAVISNFNLEKWDKISKEALKQCGGIKFMNISSPQKLKNLDFSSYDLKIVAYEKEKEYTLKRLFNMYNAINPIFIIGPEGGLEEEEIIFLKKEGFITLGLGRKILRTETASILLGGILVNGS